MSCNCGNVQQIDGDITIKYPSLSKNRICLNCNAGPMKGSSQRSDLLKITVDKNVARTELAQIPNNPDIIKLAKQLNEYIEVL